MSVKIRLTRTGKKGKTSYRIVAMDESERRDGKPIELLGYYDPSQKPPVIKINEENLSKWIKNGARLTETLKKILKV
jgi:small subunit ribosomal protein S16